ncbi:MAG: hypothetical protein GY868_12035 [Deltaproteobacteria bacterium]|nr:hypothetical protein [Deltaproteobacteria bacterium]
MLTEEIIKEQLVDLEEKYVDFMLTNCEQWRVWAEASNRMAAGETVERETIPGFFQPDFDWAAVVLDMEDQGGFNWNNPRIAQLFAQATQTPFYQLWGETLAEISLRLARITGAGSLLEIGAGRGNLTSMMMAKLAAGNAGIPLLATDAQETVLEPIGMLKNGFPMVGLETCVWDINGPPPGELMAKAVSPVLLYERASITYAHVQAIENLAQAADILVMGDYFNYSGELFAYDHIFEKIGLKPLMYAEVKAVFDRCFPNQYILDRRLNAEIGLPNVTIVIAWK